MKRIILIMLVFLLASCGAAEEKISDEFCADVFIDIGGREYLAAYEKRNEFDKLTFVSPENLAGLDLTLQNGVVTVKMGETFFESVSLSKMFDFLPVTGNETKTMGNREYTIDNIRGVE